MFYSSITGDIPARLRLRRLTHRLNGLFLATVVVPTLAAIVYFGLLASDVYTSQSQFVVRSPDKPAATGIGALLKSAGFSNAGEEAFVTHDYMVSRDALKSLNENDRVARAFGDPAISMFDRFNPLGMNGSFEDLFAYYRKMVATEYDSQSSITTLTTRAFKPDDARRMNEQLLQLSESLVNRLNDRGRYDLVRYAQREVDEAKVEAQRAAAALGAYRNRFGVIDPERQAPVQLQMVSKLQDELIGAKTQLVQLRALAPENPQIPMLETRIASLSRQIDVELGRVAGGQRSLSATAVQYQRLQLEREFADKRLGAALASLQESRNEAPRKQAYVERIVEPNLPDEAREPRRLRGIFATLILGLVAYGIMTMLFAGIREHRQ